MILLEAATSSSGLTWGVMIMIPLVLASIGIPILFGFLTKNAANKKGYTSKWFWFGFFCSFVGLIVACAIRPNGGTQVKQTIDNADAIKKYKELYDQGAITEEEYNNKKAELLK